MQFESQSERGFCTKSNELGDNTISEPGAVATGQRVNLKNDESAKTKNTQESVWPVATAPGSDVEDWSLIALRAFEHRAKAAV
jgi:hypothetical protein